jgi:hypothetical protein
MPKKRIRRAKNISLPTCKFYVDMTQTAPDTTVYIVPGHLAEWTVENLLRAYSERQRSRRSRRRCCGSLTPSRLARSFPIGLHRPAGRHSSPTPWTPQQLLVES